MPPDGALMAHMALAILRTSVYEPIHVADSGDTPYTTPLDAIPEIWA